MAKSKEIVAASGNQAVSSSVIAAMEKSAIVGLNRPTLGGGNAGGEDQQPDQETLENKYGTGNGGDGGYAGDAGVIDREIEAETNATAKEDDLEPIKDEEDAAPKVVEPVYKKGEEPSITITFLGNRVGIKVNNMAKISNAVIQRALQRIHRKMHHIRLLEGNKDKLAAAEKANDSALVEQLKNVVDNMQKSVDALI